MSWLGAAVRPWPPILIILLFYLEEKASTQTIRSFIIRKCVKIGESEEWKVGYWELVLSKPLREYSHSHTRTIRNSGVSGVEWRERTDTQERKVMVFFALAQANPVIHVRLVGVYFTLLSQLSGLVPKWEWSGVGYNMEKQASAD